MIVRFLARSNKFDPTSGVTFEFDAQTPLWPIPTGFDLLWPAYKLRVQSTGWDFGLEQLVVVCCATYDLIPVEGLSMEMQQDYINEAIAIWQKRGWTIVEDNC